MKKKTSGNLYLRHLFLCVVSCCILFHLPVVNALPAAGYTEYFIPGSEDQLWDVFYAMDSYGMTQDDGMHSIISVAAATDGVTVYYDHWENSYTFDPDNPWTTCDFYVTLNKGEVQNWDSTGIAIPRDSGEIAFDGMDHLYVAGGPVTVTRGSWPESTGTRDSILVEVLPTTPFLTEYTIPVGDNLATSLGYNDFNRTYVIVQSLFENNHVVIDDPKTGSVDVETDLGLGDVTQLHRIDSGTTVSADLPVQVQIIAGFYTSTSHWMTRGFTCIPSTVWDNDYYSPVPSFQASPTPETNLYIFNPNDTALTVYYEDLQGTGSFQVGPDATLSYYDGAARYVPNNSGVHLYADRNFWAVGSADTESPNWEWGFALIPGDLLTEEYQIAWAPGSTRSPPTENGSPVFVTPIEDYTIVYVDYAPNDGAADDSFTVNRLNVIRLFDPPGEPAPGYINTGMNIWATAPIAVTWGQDPEVAGTGNPYIDLGYSSIAVPPDEYSSVLQLDKSTDQVIFSAGSSALCTYTLQITSFGFPVEDVDVSDQLPPGWTYVMGSTTITLPDGSLVTGSAADPDIIAEPDLVWNRDIQMNPDPNNHLTIEYQASCANPVEGSYYRNIAEAVGYRTVAGQRQTFTARDHVFQYVSNLTISKTSDVTAPIQPGQTILYTITVTNNGAAPVENVIVDDPLPDYTSYVANSSEVTVYEFDPDTFRDEFNSQLYTNNNGTLNWLAGWREIGETTNPTGGNVQVMTDTGYRPSYSLRIRNTNSTVRGIYREANLSGAYHATLSFYYRRSSNLETSDYVTIDVSVDSGSSYQELGRIYGTGANDPSYLYAAYDLTGYISANTRIRFRGIAASNNDDLWLDDIQISIDRDRVAANYPAGSPPNLITESDGYDVYPGESMIVTFEVLVDSDIPPEIREIENIVYVTSPEQKKTLTAHVNNPTLASISMLDSYVDNGRTVICWETSSEVDTVGFRLERRNMATREFEPVHSGILPGLLSAPQGGFYRLVDGSARTGETYCYRLVEIESRSQKIHGPYWVNINSEKKMPRGYSNLSLPVTEYDREARVNMQSLQRIARSGQDISSEGSGSVKPSGVIKIPIAEEGVYFVSADRIAKSLCKEIIFIKDCIRNGNMRLMRQGKAVAYQPDPLGNGLIFYAQESNDPFSTTSIYWLSTGLGVSMPVITGPGPEPGLPSIIIEPLHLEEDVFPLTAIFHDPAADFWAWDYVFAGYYQITVPFSVPSILPDSQAMLTVRFIGGTDTQADPDHHAQILINGQIVSDTYWNGVEEHIIQTGFAQNLLQPENNQITIIGLTDTDAPYSVFYIDSIDINLVRFAEAVGQAVKISNYSDEQLTVSGFDTDNIVVLDISEPDMPVLDNRTRIFQTESGWSASIALSQKQNDYFAFSPGALKTPKLIVGSNAGYLYSDKNCGDYIVISPSSLIDGARVLTDYHRDDVDHATIVPVQDIYDAFGYGTPNPYAIRDFLGYASSFWHCPPQAVVLLGNGTYDYKNLLGYTDNLLPSPLVDTPYGLFACDGCLADFMNSDGVPDIPIGRIPALSNQDIYNYVDKLILQRSHESTRQVVFTADNPDQGGDFPGDSNILVRHIPQDYTTQKVYLSELSLEDARASLIQSINAGVDYVNYIGHGSIDRYTEEGLFVSDDIMDLMNLSAFPVFSSMTCTAGRYEIPGFDCISEALILQPSGGSLAVFAPTGLSIEQPAMVLDIGFIQNLFIPGTTVGEAMVNAKRFYQQIILPRYILDIYNLLGDPLVSLPE